MLRRPPSWRSAPGRWLGSEATRTGRWRISSGARPVRRRPARPMPAARVNAQLGDLAYQAGHLEGGIERMEQAFQVLSGEDHDEDFATLAAELGRLHFFYGNRELAIERIEVSLDAAERLCLPEQLSQALNTKAMMLFLFNRREEASVLLQHALKVALDNGRHRAALRAYNNLVYSLEATRSLRRGAGTHGTGRRAGPVGPATVPGRPVCSAARSRLFISLGHWREAVERAQEIEASEHSLSAGRSVYEVLLVAEVYVQRGDLATARRMVERAASFADSTDDVQVRGVYACCLSLLLRKRGRRSSRRSRLPRSPSSRETSVGSGSPIFKLGIVAAIEAALDLGEYAEPITCSD